MLTLASEQSVRLSILAQIEDCSTAKVIIAILLWYSVIKGIMVNIM